MLKVDRWLQLDGGLHGALHALAEQVVTGSPLALGPEAMRVKTARKMGALSPMVFWCRQISLRACLCQVCHVCDEIAASGWYVMHLRRESHAVGLD